MGIKGLWQVITLHANGLSILVDYLLLAGA
jgi:hypothetical protein